MAESMSLPHYPVFDTSGSRSSQSVRWKKWLERWEEFMIGLGIDDVEDDRRKKALLLHYAGKDVHDIFDTLPDRLRVTGDADSVTHFGKAKAALNKHFVTTVNEEIESQIFRECLPDEQEESTRSYYTRLCALAETCGFANIDREIKSQIIQYTNLKKLRVKALSDPTQTLAQLLEFASTSELAMQQAKKMEENLKGKVAFVAQKTQHKSPKSDSSSSKKHPKKKLGKKNDGPSTDKKNKCRYCGGEYPHAKKGREGCPAYGKRCGACSKKNHFESVCRGNKPQVHNVQSAVEEVAAASQDSEDSDYVYSVAPHSTTPIFRVKLNGEEVKMMADSGASINIISHSTLKKMSSQPAVKPTKVKIYAYNSDQPLAVLGKVSLLVETDHAKEKEEFVVVEGKAQSLLSWEASQRLKLLRVAQVTHAIKTDKITIHDLVKSYEHLFHGVGKLKGVQVKLHIDKSVKPMIQHNRRVPFHVRKDVEAQVNADEEAGIIEKPTGPTPWVSPVVVVPKKTPGKVRVCVDMRLANKAIKRERHNTPTLNELIHKLNGAVVFSKMDLNQGYNQLELSPESRYITTFTTHVGLRQYKRLYFGISSAAEVFQEKITEALAGLPGVLNVSDDILVYGSSHEEHLSNLKRLLKRIEEKGLTLNRSKCEFGKKKLEFFGHIFGDEGLRPDPAKVDSLENLEEPKNASEVRSLLGMLNYCGSRFIPHFATLTNNMRQLTKKNTVFRWGKAHTEDFVRLRECLASKPVLQYFDPEKETKILVDASPVGLGAILMQEEDEVSYVVAYASHALTSVQQRYSQTEREGLAVLWACKHFHLYIFGKPILVLTDHKPLLGLYNNPKAQLPVRMQNWALRLQPYQLTVQYRRGSDNPADYLSRHPKQQKSEAEAEVVTMVTEAQVQYVVDNATPKAMSTEEVREATAQDATLQAAAKAMETGAWNNKSLLYRVRHELSMMDGIMLKGNKIVVPETLQARAVQLAHEGHQGIVKTKALARERIWFPGIDKKIEQVVKDCFACQVTTPTVTREPLQMSELPEGPWEELSLDFGHISATEYIMVLTDEYSRFPIVEVIQSTSSRTVIPRLDKILSEFGFPISLKTDNGPPFNSSEFAAYAEAMKFKHRKITPLWPRANAETERFMRTVKKSIKAARIEQKPWKQELQKFLRSYRSTPHTTTGETPFEMLMRREMKIKLPQLDLKKTQPDPCDERMRRRDKAEKLKMKAYADSKAYVRPSDIQMGDSVVVKDTSIKKSGTPYDPEPLEVVQKKGSMITAENGRKTVTRNSSFFKQVNADVCKEKEADVDINDMIPPDDMLTAEAQEDPDATDVPPTQPQQSPPQVASRRYPRRETHKPSKFKDFQM